MQQLIEAYEQEIDKLKCEILTLRKLAENREKKQLEDYQKKMMEITEQNEELTKKVLIILNTPN